MRAVLLVVLTGCGFTTQSSGGQPSNDASDTPLIDAAIPILDAPMQMIDAPPPPVPHDCGGGYVTLGNSGTQSKYKKVNQLTTWTTAKAACANDTAYLVIPETLAEGIAVFTYVNPNNNSPYYWAGIEDPNNDSIWTTVLGTTFANPPFQSGQPSNNSGEIYILVGSNGRFYDWRQDGTQEYACECAP
jgi:hypothetical protein